MHQIKILSIGKKSKFGMEKLKNPKKILPLVIVLLLVGLLLFRILSPKAEQSSPFNFIFNPGPNINHTDDKVNVLLLGTAGGKHDGADLTDTIMVASINYKTNKVYLISLPRDLWLDEVKGKINSVYEKGGEGEGIDLSKKIIGGVLGIPIHYGIRVDFNGFTKAVDEVGGIDVSIDKTFDDYLYPITGKEQDMCGLKEEEREFNEEEAKKLNIETGKRKVLIDTSGQIATDSAEPNKGYEYFKCRYEHIGFKAGVSHMDGSTALKFARSRMGSNGEGSDFARSRRQQRVIDSFREKVLSLETLVNPGKITSLISIFGNSIDTDLGLNDFIELYKIAKENKETASFVISDQGKDSLLTNPPLGQYGGAWVLIPRGGKFDKVQEYVKSVLNGEVSSEASSSARTR